LAAPSQPYLDSDVAAQYPRTPAAPRGERALRPPARRPRGYFSDSDFDSDFGPRSRDGERGSGCSPRSSDGSSAGISAPAHGEVQLSPLQFHAFQASAASSSPVLAAPSQPYLDSDVAAQYPRRTAARPSRGYFSDSEFDYDFDPRSSDSEPESGDSPRSSEGRRCWRGEACPGKCNFQFGKKGCRYGDACWWCHDPEHQSRSRPSKRKRERARRRGGEAEGQMLGGGQRACRQGSAAVELRSGEAAQLPNALRTADHSAFQPAGKCAVSTSRKGRTCRKAASV